MLSARTAVTGTETGQAMSQLYFLRVSAQKDDIGDITNHICQVILKNAISHAVIVVKCQGNGVFKWNSFQTESVQGSTTHLLSDRFFSKLITFSNWIESEINHHRDPVKIRWLLKDKPQSSLHLNMALLPIYFQINIEPQLFFISESTVSFSV